MIYSDWIERYGGRDFPLVKFRPGAAFTTMFGLDRTFDVLRLHPGIDRAKGSGIDGIYCPFDVYKTEWIPEYPSFGSMFILYPDGVDFEVRIMHMEETPRVEGDVKGGSYIGEAGNKGVGTGRHTHVEIISSGPMCDTLESILLKKYGQGYDKSYKEGTIKAYCDKYELTDGMGYYEREIKKRKIESINSIVCRRIDYHTGERRTFYSSLELFGM
jgi:murein DD-endopeptidase MepM/ murein hydrolase activator NlpD